MLQRRDSAPLRCGGSGTELSDAVHLLSEAPSARATRPREVSRDPEFVTVPFVGLLDPAYLRARARRSAWSAAWAPPPPAGHLVPHRPRTRSVALASLDEPRRDRRSRRPHGEHDDDDRARVRQPSNGAGIPTEEQLPTVRCAPADEEGPPRRQSRRTRQAATQLDGSDVRVGSWWRRRSNHRIAGGSSIIRHVTRCSSV